jgi:AcrR family transcriptional regulator
LTRLSKSARREQLLDTAAELLIEQGARGITMEGLAARAGVSKALPYRHFADADEVLVALHEQELRGISDRIGDALRNAPQGESQVAAAIRAYLDVIEERGDILARLRAPGSPAMRAAGGGRTANEFVAGLLRSTYGLSPQAAAVGAAAVFGAINGLVEAWALGHARRREVEAMALSVATHVGRSTPAIRSRRRSAAG